jgi:hypothetical protein
MGLPVYSGDIIDFHIHIGKKDHWHPWVLAYLRNCNPSLFKNFDMIMNPNNLEALLADAGVDYAVILAENSPLTTGVVPNTYVYDFCKNHQKFIPFASINPVTTKHPEKDLEQCVGEMKFKGLKLYPSYQHFFPNDKTVYPLYEKAADLHIPIMFHTGSSIYRHSKIKYADPLHLDDVASDFPNLKIVMAHSGRGFWYVRAFFLSKIHKNVYMELSGLPPLKVLTYFPELEKNREKVIFGSDWPGVKSIKENIHALDTLPLKKTTLELIFCKNAKKILSI